MNFPLSFLISFGLKSICYDSSTCLLPGSVCMEYFFLPFTVRRSLAYGKMIEISDHTLQRQKHFVCMYV